MQQSARLLFNPIKGHLKKFTNKIWNRAEYIRKVNTKMYAILITNSVVKIIFSHRRREEKVLRKV